MTEPSPHDVVTDLVDVMTLRLPEIAAVDTGTFAACVMRILDFEDDPVDPLIGGADSA